MLNALRAIVGDKGLVTDPAEMEPYLVDWRQRRRGSTLAVVQPTSTAEVSAVVALCAAQEQPIFPVGGNTGLCFGAVPESNRPGKPGIMLSLRRMNRIRGIDRASGIATVDAGVVLGDLHNAAAEAGRQFPLHLGSEGSAQIGGLISTNAGGTSVVRYGPMRDLVAGLEVVLADGRVLSDLTALRKDNTGYMLRHLFIGAEGSLGVITGAALRLHPQTPNTAHAWVAAADPADAVALLAALQDRAGSYIQAFELVSASQFALVRKHAERARFPFAEIPAWSVLIELGSEDATTGLRDILEEVLGAALEQGELLDAVIATSEQQAAEFWHIRHSVSEANKKEGASITHDVAVRSSEVAPFIKAADEVAAKLFPDAYSEVVCHLGDGNVHYILMFTHAFWAALPDPEGFALEVERAIHDVAAHFGGTFSAEHGVGRKLTEELERLADPLRYELMIKVKALFDPQNLMNPGVLLAPEHS
ncbi:MULTISPECIES: FAD-binding oxidoreductase [unclassified Chelatococcus]|uniref:FAD-binding oxidoreductase n=1 Tax=unclassified Chelatococcus TaxID=2638111 RepID=UPI0002DC4475|nr:MULTISPECIES: FAD-binding oxidoreductase [unclassified Chelatococcus]ALA18629.1 FAD-dependent oxidoreductase [Chelatococcus sp. CO-6]